MDEVEVATSVAEPKKKRKKQGRHTTTNRALAERERVSNELNHCTEPYSEKTTENNPNTLIALMELYNLSPIDLDSPEEVETRCADYIKWCAKFDALPSFSSLALALGVDRITLLEWGTKSRIGQPHSRIIKRVKALITSNTILKGADGSLNPVYAMFLLNNSSQGFTNNSRLEVSQAPTEQIEAPKLDDVIEIYDSKDISDT